MVQRLYYFGELVIGHWALGIGKEGVEGVNFFVIPNS